eukprot:13111737-Alexandrium_andersonii.AAC.1
MSASLVGSEMCIRDSCYGRRPPCWQANRAVLHWRSTGEPSRSSGGPGGCLLYTSDAADDM